MATGGLDGLLRSMNDAPFSLVAEWRHRDPDEEAPGQLVATYRLDVESFLVWRYTVMSSTGHVEYEAHSDGRVYHRREGGHHAEQRLPARTTLDDPWVFYSWLRIPETWVIELVRPLDLLALVFVDDMAPEPGALDDIRLTARPIGREPSPYLGIAQPHRSTCDLLLDCAEGALREVTVSQGGAVTDHMRIVELHRAEGP